MQGTGEASALANNKEQTVGTSVAQSSSRTRIVSIALNTFREAVRDRVLYNLVLFVLLLIGGAIFLGELSGGQEKKIITDLGLSAMLIFGVFIGIFVGVSLVYKEIERRTVYALFAKPVGRAEFLIGKYLGLCLTLLLNTIIMGAGVSLALIYVSRGWDPLALQIWPAILLIYVELMIITAIALVFSSFSSPALSALLTFFIFIAGHFSSDLKTLAAFSRTASVRWLFTALYYALPNLANYSFITQTAHGRVPGFQQTLIVVLYGCVYISLMLAIAAMIFARRNFK